MLFTVGTVEQATREALEAGWGLHRDQVAEFAKRPLGTIASDVKAAIETQLIVGVFGIEQVLRHILKRNEEHARAIDSLVATKELNHSDVPIVHVRLLEESFTTAAFLLADPGRYAEFGWRWKSFPRVHGIRNRVFGLGKPLSDEMTSWIKSNERELAWMDPKGRLTADMTNDKTREQWEKCGNWLAPMTIKDIFEKAGRLESYKRKGYDMGSQSVHLSPMGDIYMSYELPHHISYAEFAMESASHYIIKMLALCQDLVKDPGSVRRSHGRENLLQTYRLLSTNPGRFSELSTKLPSYAAFVEAVVKKPGDTEAIIESVIGKRPASKVDLQLGTVPM